MGSSQDPMIIEENSLALRSPNREAPKRRADPADLAGGLLSKMSRRKDDAAPSTSGRGAGQVFEMISIEEDCGLGHAPDEGARPRPGVEQRAGGEESSSIRGGRGAEEGAGRRRKAPGGDGQPAGCADDVQAYGETVRSPSIPPPTEFVCENCTTELPCSGIFSIHSRRMP